MTTLIGNNPKLFIGDGLDPEGWEEVAEIKSMSLPHLDEDMSGGFTRLLPANYLEMLRQWRLEETLASGLPAELADLKNSTALRRFVSWEIRNG